MASQAAEKVLFLHKAVGKLTKVNPQEDNESAKKLLFM